MLPIVVMLLLQDHMYYSDFRSLSDACHITTPNVEVLLKHYCKDDLVEKLGYLLDRLDKSYNYQCCITALNYRAYGCIKMLMCRNMSRLISAIVYDRDMIDVFNYLKKSDLLYGFSGISVDKNNQVLQGLIDLYAKGILYRPSLYCELEEKNYYDLVDKIKHVYY